MYFHYFVLIFPWKDSGAHNLKKLKSFSPNDAKFKLGHWFWRRRFLYFVNIFSLFVNYLPLEIGLVLQLIRLESPFPKNALNNVWLKLALCFWRRRKCEKFTTTTTTLTITTTDKGQIVIRKAHVNLWFR